MDNPEYCDECGFVLDYDIDSDEWYCPRCEFAAHYDTEWRGDDIEDAEEEYGYPWIDEDDFHGDQ